MAIDPSGRLRLLSPQDDRLLSKVLSVQDSAGKDGGDFRATTILTAPGDGSRALCLEVSLLDPAGQPGGPGRGALITSVDTSRPIEYDTRAFAKVYGLTKTECALALPIAEGMTNAQIAAGRNRSVATVNVQVKALLAKTSASNRTHFVRLLNNFRSIT